MKVTTETSQEAVIGNINTYAIMVQTERMTDSHIKKDFTDLFIIHFLIFKFFKN